MKILIVSRNYPPENDGGVPRIKGFEKYFIKKNIDLHILTAGFKLKHSIEENNNLTVHRVFDPVHKKTLYVFKAFNKLFRVFMSFFNKHISYYFFWEKLIVNYFNIYFKKDFFDYILVSYPPKEVLFFLDKIETNSKIIVDYRDPLIFETAESEIKKNHPKYFEKLKILEKSLIIKSHLTITIAPQITEYLLNTYKKRNIYTITNGYDELNNILNNYEVKLFEKEKKFFSNKFINILYTGTLTHYDKNRKANNLFEALLKLDIKKRSKFRFIFYGKSHENDLKKYKTLIDEAVVVLRPEVSRNLSVEIQKLASYLLIVTDNVRTCVTTGKIFEYLQANKPIIGLTKNTHVEYIINKTNTGKCVDPTKIDNIYLFLNEILREKKINYEPKNVEFYSRENQLNILWETLS